MVDADSVAIVVYAALAITAGAAVRSNAVRATRGTVTAAVPWTVTCAAVIVAGRAGAYEGVELTYAPAVVVAVLATFAIGTWVVLAQLATLRDLPYSERYLTAAGLGASTVVSMSLLTHATPTVSGVLWLVLSPIVAGILAAGGYFALGLVYADTLAELQLTGLFVVGAVVFEGVASAAAIEHLGADEAGPIAAGIGMVPDAAGVVVSSWLLLPVQTFLAVGFVALCGYLAQRRPALGNGCALAGSTLAIGAGTIVLLSAALLG